MTDPYVGRLSFFRVYSGHLTTGSSVLNSTKGQKERIGRILQMHANHREDIEEVYAGDIEAAVGLKNTTTGDTLCDEKAPIILESMVLIAPRGQRQSLDSVHIHGCKRLVAELFQLFSDLLEALIAAGLQLCGGHGLSGRLFCRAAHPLFGYPPAPAGRHRRAERTDLRR